MKARKVLALAPIALLPLTFAAPAVAASSGETTYQAMLKPVALNGQDNATAEVMIKLNGNTATITEQASGLAKTFNGGPFPHAQHIHGGAAGSCPVASDDADGDGVIATGEAGGNYGPIQTSLTVSGDTSPKAALAITKMPSGDSFNYSRTIELSDDAVKALTGGTAVIVVHGLDPATAPAAAGEKMSELAPDLPLAATAPALCGAVQATQMTTMPSGAVNTGGTAPTNTNQLPLYVFGGTAVAGAGALLFARRRSTAVADNR